MRETVNNWLAVLLGSVVPQGMSIAVFLLLSAMVAAAAFYIERQRRREAQCHAEGHQWRRAHPMDDGPYDHLRCLRCGHTNY